MMIEKRAKSLFNNCWISNGKKYHNEID